MQKFTFTKHGSGCDPQVTMEFEAEYIDTVKQNFEDFLFGSGFHPETDDEKEQDVPFEYRLNSDDVIHFPESWMWDDSLPPVQ
jgi:hypothetical protein